MDDNQTERPISSDIQSQLTDLSKEMKEMAASNSTLVKAIIINNAVAQSDPSSIADPEMVHKAGTDPIRVTVSGIKKKGDSHLDRDNDNSSTYPIQESTSAFLELTFGLRKPIDNKTCKAWEAKFQVPECDATRCPKLDTIIRTWSRRTLSTRIRNFQDSRISFLMQSGPS